VWFVSVQQAASCSHLGIIGWTKGGLMAAPPMRYAPASRSQRHTGLAMSHRLHSNLGACFAPQRDPARLALIDTRDWEAPRSFTYAAIEAECDAVARGLLARGFRRGDRIGILSLNRWEYLTAFLGTMRGGLVSVPISGKLAPATIEHIARDAKLAAVFHDAGHAALVPAGVPGIGFDDPASFAALRDPGAFEPVPIEGREIGMMLYTSGSTGQPKGVLLSHESQRWALERALQLGGDVSAERFIVAAPMFHMNATFSAKSALAGGATMVMLPAFDARRYAEAIARFRVTALTSVPTMLALVAREVALRPGLDLSSVRRVMMGSAPLTQALIGQVQALFPGAPVTNSYGTTEAGPMAFGPHPAGKPRPALSIGYPAPGSEVELREGETPDQGVLYMRNPSLMEGYANLPEKTAEALRGGWYRSGDIMRRDADGFYYFLGRADDMFVVGGENVWPGEVEKLLERMPGIHQACVVPVPDEIKGTLPFAFVVPRLGGTPTEAAVKAWALAEGPAFAHPRFVEFDEAIPLAATNKPDRRLLTERAATIATARRAAGERADR
jgi:acyl-CoA synthetase (AMP-forming)/AMP-acid ligase II